MNQKHKLLALSATAAALTPMALAHLIGTPSGWLALMLMGALAAVLTTGSNYLLDRHDASYTKRIKNGTVKEWDVQVNGVTVGKVTDASYALFQQSAFRDGRIAAAQLFNVGIIAVNAFGKIGVAVPLLVFWSSAALAIFAPDSFQSTVRELQQTDLAGVASVVRSLLTGMLALTTAAVVAMAAMGNRFGFKNHYSEAVARLLRQHCNAPADGKVRLSCNASIDGFSYTYLTGNGK